MPRRPTIKGLQNRLDVAESKIARLTEELATTRKERDDNHRLASLARVIRERNDFESNRFAELHREFAHLRVAYTQALDKLASIRNIIKES